MNNTNREDIQFMPTTVLKIVTFGLKDEKRLDIFE